MTITINLTERESLLVDSYAEAHSISVGQAFHDALFEKIEAEQDTAAADAAYKEYVDSGKISRPFSCLKDAQQL